MKLYKVREFAAALKKKGFQVDRKTSDDIYYLWVRGQKTQVFTKASMGSGGEELRPPILKKIQQQLRFDTSGQLADFIECPIQHGEYVAFLQQKGVVTSRADPP